MATVTIAIADTGLMETWDNPAAQSGVVTAGPVGRVQFSGTTSITAKGATDETEVILTLSLPRGYFYRLANLHWSAFSTSATPFAPSNGFEFAAPGIVAENGVSTYRFFMMNDLAKYWADSLVGGGQVIGAVKTDPDTVTNDFGTIFYPGTGLSSYFIDASGANSTVLISWMDTSADATAAVSFLHFGQAYMYTVEQGRSWRANDDFSKVSF